MGNTVLQRFNEAVTRLKKEKKILKKDIAVSLGYKLSAFSNVLQGRTKLPLELIMKFCTTYDINIDEIIPKQEYPVGITHIYTVDSIKDRMESIEKQLEVIDKTNNMMKQLYLSGIELAESQVNNMRNLKVLIGA